MAFSHTNLENYYNTNFSLLHYHKWSITELENMVPWEKDIYVSLLLNELELERERMKAENR